MTVKHFYAYIAALFLFFSGYVAAKTESFNTLPSQASIDYFDINAAQHNIKMSLLGIHYTLHFLPIPDFYTGLGMYGAVTGNKGGFFAFGFDNDYRPKLYKSLYLDSGIFIGGGGARSSQVGGGLILLPHIGFSYQMGAERINLDYSYVTFPSGQISGSQAMFGIIFPGNFDFFIPSNNSSNHNVINWKDDRLYLSPIIQIYHPKKGITSAQGTLQDGNSGLIGAEAGKFISDRTYFALRATAIATGNSGNGYMSVMGGAGYQYPLTQRFYFVNDIFVGSGGGGEVDTGNGMLLEADTGFAWKMFSDITPKISMGYLIAPDGRFKSWVSTLGFNYNLGWLSASDNSHALNYYAPENYIQHWRVALFNQTYFHPQREDTRHGNINLIGGGLEQQLNSHWYLSYRVGFSYQGEQSGGLATGIIGTGYQFNPTERIHPHAEVLLGAAGGGGVDVGGGLFVEPEVGLRFDMTRRFGLDTALGRMISTTGHFNVTVINVGGVFSFGKLSA